MKKLLKPFKKKASSGAARDLDDDTFSGRLGRKSSKIVDVGECNDNPIKRTGNVSQHGEGQDLNTVQPFSSFDGWLSSFQPASPTASELPATDNNGARPSGKESVKRQLVDIFPTGDKVPLGDSITIVVSNVRKIVGDEVVDVRMKVASYITFAEFNELLCGNGLKEVIAVRNSAIPDFTLNAVDDWPVAMVVAGPSSYSEKNGFRINQDESFHGYTNKLSQLRMLCKDSELVVNDGELRIAFHRTLRLPEDGNVYDLPTTFGALPLYSINGVTSRLLKSQNENMINIAKKGGVFLPLYQREATLISFTSTCPFAIRVFVGGVNAVSGRPWNIPSKTSEGEQDYITVPSQEWLDGIAVDRKTVRQFVAMPLGAGYSVEKQVTGKEELGGFQLEIIPSGGGMCLSLGSYRSPEAIRTQTPRQAHMRCGECLTIQGAERRPPGAQLLRGFYESGGRTSQVYQKWWSGAAIQMTAIYRYELTVQFYDNHGSPTERIEVDCLPWDSIHDLRNKATDKKIRWNDYNDRFDVFFEDKSINTNVKTYIIDLGVQNHGIIKVCERKPTYSPPGYDVNSYASSQPHSYASSQPHSYASSQPHPYASSQPQSFSPSQPQSRPSPQPQFLPSAQTQSRIQSRPSPQPQSLPSSQLQSLPSSQPQYFSSPQPQSLASSQPFSYGSEMPPPPPLSGGFQSQRLPRSESPIDTPILRALDTNSLMDHAPALRWDLGIAAGAQIRQSIEKDKHNPTIWRKSSSCLINVQILNSVAFEALTGMLTPPTPITPESYLKYGFPFYTQYGEEAAKTSGAENFQVIKSVGQLDSLGANINLGTSMLPHGKVGCTVCKKNFCDCIIRPCNHTFCSNCVWEYMEGGARIICWLCSRNADQILGFSAPMGLPGQDGVDLSTAEVRTLPPRGGQFAFTSIAELMGSEVPVQKDLPHWAELEA